MQIELFLEQPTGGGGILYFPALSKVGGTGAGVVTLSSGTGQIDRLRGNFDRQVGSNGAFMWDPPTLNYSSQAAPSPAPTIGTAVAGSGTSIDLSWTDNSANEAGFSIWRSPGASTTNFVQIGTAFAGVQTYHDSAVTPGSQYSYQVRAFNSGGETPTAANVNGTAGSGVAPGDIWQLPFNDGYADPAHPTAAATNGPTGNITNPRWTNAVYPAATPNKSAWNPQASLTTPVLNPITQVGGSGTTTYVYRVTAKRSIGTHGVGGVGTANNGPATLTTGNYNVISWSGVTGADAGYDIYRTTNNGTIGGTGLIGSMAAGVTTFNDMALLRCRSRRERHDRSKPPHFSGNKL